MQLAQKKITPIIISMASLMQAVDTSIINTAIPAMAHSLKVNPIDLKIALISYLLTLAIFIPISGWVADKWGAKRVFIYALWVFTLSSLWCGFAHSLTELIIARSVQGIGASFSLPIGRLIIARSFNRNEIVATMNRVITIAAFGLMLGPVLGGVITYYFTWPWIFWINIPIGIVGITLAQRFLPNLAIIKVPPLDIIGFLLFGASLALFTFGASAISEAALSGWVSVMTILVSLLLFALYLWHSKRQPYPVVNTALLQHRTFKVAFLANLWARLGFGGIPFLVPLLLQITLGYSSYKSGLLVAPIACGVVMAKQLSEYVLRQLGYKKTLIINTVLVSLSIWLLIFITPNASIYLIACLSLLFGFLTSMQFTAMNSLTYAGIPSENLSATTSIMSTVQQLAQSFGVALAAISLHLFAIGETGNSALTLYTFQMTFFILGLVTLLAIVIFIPLKPSDGLDLLTRNKE